jgi:DNA topoisomerase-1
MTPSEMTLDDALKMLSLPRIVGEHPEKKEPITAQLGRYGPYISCGKDSRSLEKEEDVFTVDLPQALTILAQPKTRGNQRKAAEPIKELGVDEFSGGVITLREGRFGLYVTDGETNASLRKGDMPEGIDNARAQELLHQRREREPVKKKRTKKKVAASAKASGKKATSKAKAAPNGDADGATDGDESEVAEQPSKAAPKKAAAKKAAAKKPAQKKLVAKKGTKAKSEKAPADSGKPASKRRPADSEPVIDSAE